MNTIIDIVCSDFFLRIVESFVISVSYVLILYLIYKIKYSTKGLFSFSKSVLIPSVAIGGFVIYLISYSTLHYKHWDLSTIWLALYSTARLFILGNDLIEIKELFHDGQFALLHLGISLIMSTIVFVFCVMFLHIIALQSGNRKKIKKSKAKENFVFIGINDASVSLARNILNNRQETNKNEALVLFIEDTISEQERQLIQPVIEKGGILVSKESFFERLTLKNEELVIHVHEPAESHVSWSEENGLLNQYGLIDCISKRKTKFFLLSEKEEDNVRISKAIIDELKTLKNILSTELFIRTILHDYLEDEYRKDIYTRTDNIEIHFLNDSTIIARKLIEANLPVNYVDPDTNTATAQKDFTPLIIGFGSIGQASLRKLVEMGQFVGSKFRAVVIDERMDTIVGRFHNRFPGLKRNYDISFVQMAVGNLDFFELLNKKPELLSYVVISLGNDELNILIALELQRFARQKKYSCQLFVRLEKARSFDQLFYEATETKLNIFGLNNDIYIEENIIRNQMLEKAIRNHLLYVRHSDPARVQKPWDLLDRMQQLSNISALEHLPTKLILMGKTKEQILNYPDENNFIEDLGAERLENLSIGEHLRWNAHYFSNGWDTWSLEEIEGNETKDPFRKIHSCLVDWEDLDLIEKRFYDVKIYDRQIVLGIFEQLKYESKNN